MILKAFWQHEIDIKRPFEVKKLSQNNVATGVFVLFNSPFKKYTSEIIKGGGHGLFINLKKTKENGMRGRP